MRRLKQILVAMTLGMFLAAGSPVVAEPEKGKAVARPDKEQTQGRKEYVCEKNADKEKKDKKNKKGKDDEDCDDGGKAKGDLESRADQSGVVEKGAERPAQPQAEQDVERARQRVEEQRQKTREEMADDQGK